MGLNNTLKINIYLNFFRINYFKKWQLKKLQLQ